jgi:hypothetical protein
MKNHNLHLGVALFLTAMFVVACFWLMAHDTGGLYASH